MTQELTEAEKELRVMNAKELLLYDFKDILEKVDSLSQTEKIRGSLFKIKAEVLK